MMRKLESLAIAFTVALTLFACGDDGGNGGDTTVAAVFPESGFAGRTTRVQITGDNANWTAPSVSFGDGVTVQSVEVVTPNALFVDLAVDAAATFGPRTVTVTEGDSVMLADSFTVESPLEVEVIGTLAQGSIVQVVIHNRDIDTPFDTSFTGDGFFEPLVFTGIELTSPTGVDLTSNISDVSEYSITTIGLIDLDATSGAFTVNSGLTMPEQVLSPGGNLEIAPRTPTALASGVAATGQIQTPLGTEIYEFTPGAAPMISNLGVSTSTAMAAPAMVIIGPSGSFSELVAVNETFILDSTNALPAKVYVIVWDPSLIPSFDFSLVGGSRTFTTVNEAGNNETAMNAQAPTLPAMVTSTLSSATDQDWIRVTATAEHVGKRIYVATIPGEERTDTVLAFFQGNGSMAFGEPSSDAGFHDTLISPPITAAGTYFVRVTASDFQAPTAMRDGYSAVVWVE